MDIHASILAITRQGPINLLPSCVGAVFAV
jgi:hypothetical protein